MVILTHLHVVFFTIFFIKRALRKRFYLSLKLLQSRTIFKQKGSHEVSSHYIFCMKFFATPNSKKIIATLRIVTVDKSELTHEIRKWISKNVLAKFVKHILKNQLYLISLKHLLAL